MANQSVVVNGHLIRAWLAAGVVVLWVPGASRAINSVTPAAGAVQQEATARQTAPTARYSPGVADIVKMVDAKVDAEVIKTYVKNSPTAYNPSATEIIALKDHGIGPEILTAMLQHGAEVRAQSLQAAQAAPPLYPGAVNPYAPAPGYDYSAQPAYPDYAYSYPVDSYAYPGYNYGWCNYGYCWPYFWPSFYIGGYPYYGYGGHRYPYAYGGRGYVGGRGYYGYGARSAAFAGSRGGFRSFSTGGRAASFARPAGGVRSAGGAGGHAVSFASHGGGGGHASGRGR